MLSWSVSLFAGAAPYTFSWSTTRALDGQKTTPRSSTDGSSHSTAIFHLETSDPGVYTYSFDKIGDVNYRPGPQGITSAARSRKLLLEQEVYARPSASFQSTAPISVCSHDSIGPSSSTSKSPVVMFRGKAPFSIELNIWTAKRVSPFVRRVDNIKTTEWKLEVPDFEFDGVGSYSIAIARVQDASGCDQDVLGDDESTIKVEVAETASIIPLSKAQDVCVGQELAFMLQGSSPWTLTSVSVPSTPAPA